MAKGSWIKSAKLRIIALTAAALSLGLAPISSPAHADAASALAERLANLKTYSASFSQQVLSETGDILENSPGELSFKRPHKFLWQTFEPFPLIILANSESVYLYDRDLAQVTEFELEEVLNTTPAGIILNAGERLDEQFLVQEALDREGETHVYSLIPLAEDVEFLRADIAFDDSGLQGLYVEDALGQKTYVAFADRTANGEIADSRFEVEFPEGVDWVKR